MPTEKPILTLAVDKGLLDRISDFRFDNRIETRSEAIRILIEKGLEVCEKEAVLTDYKVRREK
jgi:metal-responsive CopG/Arc/MetJ family transcriptional regulator